MNILVTNDDGPEAYGLTVLLEAAKTIYANAKVIILTPNCAMGGQGMSVSCEDCEDISIMTVGPDRYACKARPADLIYLALGHPKKFLESGNFDLVLTGVNHGANVGMDVLHSGTVGMAILAATYFDVCAVAFSQHMELDRMESGDAKAEHFLSVSEFIRGFLPAIMRQSGRCYNVNFPMDDPKGYRHCEVARYSRFRPNMFESRRQTGQDVTELDNGFITVSELVILSNQWGKSDEREAIC